MEQKVLGHIFEPFYTTKEIGKGTGLGLASVYGIVKNHGGHIHCCSEVGKGTVFQIFLPAVDPRTQVAAVELQTHPQRGTETILVVDDEEAVRAFASQVLQRFGYTVLTAASGEDALKIYSNQTRAIDLVILDLGMPGMGGHRCLLELLQNDPAAGVVIASGYSMEREVKKTMEAGAKGFIPKPYYLGELLKKVRLFCDQKGNSGLMPEEYPGPKTNPEDFDS